MKYTYSQVSIDEIDTTDISFKITTDTNTVDLEKSIRSTGLINRPILIKRKSAYIIVSGFRRIRSLKNLDEHTFPVKIIEQNATDLHCLRISITDNSFQRPLNISEQAEAVEKLSNYIPEKKNFYQTVSEILNISPNPDYIRKLHLLSGFNEDIKQLIISEKISFSLLKELSKFDENILQALTLYFQNMKLSLNKQREFLTLLFEISKREAVSIDTFLNKDEFLRSVIENRDLERNQKSSMIRSYLKKRRYPHLTHIENEYRNLVKTLSVPKGVSISPPRNFEGSTFNLAMSFDNYSELLSIREEFEKMVTHPVMKKISDKEFYDECLFP